MDGKAEVPQIDPEKKAAIEKRIASDKAVYEEWIKNPKNKNRLNMPKEAARYLAVSEQIYLAAQDPDAVDVALISEDHDLSVIVYERKNEPVGNEEALQKYMKNKINAAEAERQGVDPQHITFIEEIQEGLITPNDFVFIGFHLQSLRPNQILVSTYLDREELRGKGIASDFYTKLRALGLEGGFRFVTGLNINYDTNLGFFKKKLGRVGLDEIRPDMKKDFIFDEFGEDMGVPETARTIEFLHFEDRTQYILPHPEPQTLEQIAKAE